MLVPAASSSVTSPPRVCERLNHPGSWHEAAPPRTADRGHSSDRTSSANGAPAADTDCVSPDSEAPMPLRLRVFGAPHGVSVARDSVGARGVLQQCAVRCGAPQWGSGRATRSRRERITLRPVTCAAIKAIKARSESSLKLNRDRGGGN